MSALGRRRAACGPSLLLSVAAGTRPAARRLWRVPSRPLGRRPLCPLSMKVSFFVSLLLFLATAPSIFVSMCPRRRRPRRFGVRRRGREIWGSPGDGIGKDRRRAGAAQLGLDGLGEEQRVVGDGRSSRAARRWWRSRGRPGRRRDKIRQPGGVGFLRRLEPGGGAKKRVRYGDLGKFLPEPPQISANLTSGPGWCHHPVLEGL